MIKPHGGQLKKSVLTKKEAREVLSRARSLPRLVIDHDTLLDVENIALGVYSPLTGFMTADESKSVMVKKRLLNNEPWTIPVHLAVHANQRRHIYKNADILLCNERHSAYGLMKVQDVYSIDKQKSAKHVFGTSDPRHPGVQKFYQSGDCFVGGSVSLLKRYTYDHHTFNLSPEETRALIQKRKWKTIVGFQTRNIPHRAHEFLQKIGLSVVDGLLIHPIIGWKKRGDFNPEFIIKSYNILIKHYYPQERVIFSGLATAMRYAGPREAVFHALIRKNFGCTHFIVGRDHAGVGGFYDTYAAHRIFDEFPDLGIIPLLLRGPFYCRRCHGVVNDKICPHPGKDKVEISGTTIRKLISESRMIPEYYLRKEVSDFIRSHRRNCFL